jgi:phytoene dehydrogenase-like protein
MDEYADVVVVGGGLAGLAAAANAADDGGRVIVLESRALGGRASTVDVGGYRFNQGPHALYESGAGRLVLDRLGVAAPGNAPPLQGALARRGDDLLPFPLGARSFLTTRLLSTRGRAQMAHALATVMRVEPVDFAGVSFQTWLDGHAWRADVRALMRALGRIASYAEDADVVSADVVLTQLQLALRGGVRYVDGGWQTLVDGLARVAVQRGAELSRHRAVRQVVSDGGRVVVDTADGRVLAGAVVLALGNAAATSAVLPDAPPWPGGVPVYASTLELGLRAPIPVPALFGIDRPLYLVQHAPPARLAPAGAALVHVAEYLSAGTAPSLERLEEHASLAGIDNDAIVQRRHLHRMVVVSSAPTPASGGLAGRPPVAVDGHPGVFVAGDWVGPRGFLADASLASGEQAGRLASRRAVAVG